METIKSQIHHIASNTNNLIQQHSKIVRLEIYERITNLIASGISSGIIILFGVFSFLFINIGLAYYLSEVFGSAVKGFLCVGVIYAVVLAIYLLLRKHVAKNRIKNAIDKVDNPELLDRINAILSGNEEVLLTDEQLSIVMESKAEYLKNPESGKTFEEFDAEIKKKYGI